MRHRDLCKSVGIRPLKVIVDFVDAVRTMELVPVQWIPVMEAQSRIATPAPTQPSQRPKPRVKKPVVPEAVLPVPMEEDEVPDDEDYEMGEDSEDEVPVGKTTRNKGKNRADIVVASAPKKGVATQGASSKRVLQESPSRQESIAKRLRTGGRQKTSKINLSGYIFGEFDPVMEGDVPGSTTAVRDSVSVRRDTRLIFYQVCEFCAGKNKDDCEALWGLKNSKPTIKCLNCPGSKQGCSFSKQDWNIGVWPTIEKSDEGNAMRAKAAEEKRKSLARKKGVSQGATPEVAGSVSDSSGTIRGSARLQLRDLGSVVQTLASSLLSLGQSGATQLPPSGTGSSLSYVVPQVHTWGRAQRTEIVTFEMLDGFHEALRDHKRSPISLLSAAAELEAIRGREVSNLGFIRQITESRQELIDGLLRDIRAEAARLRPMPPRRVEARESEQPVAGPSGTNRDDKSDEGSQEGNERDDRANEEASGSVGEN
jgi:hypothetical protein